MKVFKNFISGFIFFLLVFIPIVGLCAEPIGMAPLNPEFIEYQEDLRHGIYTMERTSDGYFLGEIPSPVDHVFTPIDDLDQRLDQAYPATYDLRTTGRVGPVRAQGTCGSCWAFASMASAESLGLPTNVWDFSEQDINDNHGFDPAPCDGGHSLIATAYCARWSGPLNETDNPYTYRESLWLYRDSATSARKHIQEVIRLPARTSFTDNNTIKYFVINKGAVYVRFLYNGSFLSADDESYYNNTTTGGGHAVAVIGWDDNYAKTNFKTGTQPPGNGAFLIRNSWGTDRHTDGYFWLSYYDANFAPRVSFSRVESLSNYGSIYQYDPLGYVRSWGKPNSNIMWGANIFKATASDKISAVSFYLTDTNASYEIKIYTNVTTGSPTSGTLAATKTGTKIYPGYYTVDLNSSISITSGQKFSIVIKFTNLIGGFGWPMAIEENLSGYSSGATSNANESFFSANGTSWTDFYSFSAEKINVCIKAFTEAQAAYTYYLPVFKPKPDHWSGLGITNLSSTDSASVQVEIYNQAGVKQVTESKTIVAKGQDAFVMGTTLSSAGWIKVTSDQPLAGLNLLGEYKGTTTDYYLADVPFTKTLSKLLLIPHVAQNTTWDTTVYLANPNTSTAAVALTYTNKNGISTTPYTTTITANGSKGIAVSTIGGSTDIRGGYVTISSSQSLTAFALYDNLKTGNYSYAGINADDISK